jgi:hypothetical protein
MDYKFDRSRDEKGILSLHILLEELPYRVRLDVVNESKFKKSGLLEVDEQGRFDKEDKLIRDIMATVEKILDQYSGEYEGDIPIKLLKKRNKEIKTQVDSLVGKYSLKMSNFYVRGELIRKEK